MAKRRAKSEIKLEPKIESKRSKPKISKTLDSITPITVVLDFSEAAKLTAAVLDLESTLLNSFGQLSSVDNPIESGDFYRIVENSIARIKALCLQQLSVSPNVG